MNSFTDWHWNKDLKLIRSDRYNLAFAEECGDASVLEATLARVTAVRDEYQGKADKARSKSEKDTFTRAIQDKKQQIAWVLEKLSEVKSWIDDNLREPKALNGESENKSTTSIPCFIKQPGHPEVKGVIKQDLGDRFVVYIPSSDSTVTVSKLFVYPDFSSSPKGYRSAYVGSFKENPRKKLHPSKNNPRKNTRRKNGFGNGSIYYRTVTKNGKNYTDAYYHYVENGKKRTKYIPKKLLDKVIDAESRSLPVADLLFLLGGDEKNPRKSSSTLSIEVDEKPQTNHAVLKADENNPRKITHPSTKRCDPASAQDARERAPRQRRKQGYGAGYIECKPIKRGNKEYKQYWYHWEIWESGDRITKKSKYIPNNRRSQIEKMNNEKAPVEEILKVLRNRSNRKK